MCIYIYDCSDSVKEAENERIVFLLSFGDTTGGTGVPEVLSGGSWGSGRQVHLTYAVSFKTHGGKT